MTSPTITTRDPALLATFYGQRGELQPLLSHLRDGLGPLQAKGPNRWLDEGRLVILHYFEPINAEDASVIQIALSPSAEVEEAWQALNWRLSRLLSDEFLPLLKPVWGYTLVYQAIADAESWRLLTPSDEETGGAAREELFAKARPLGARLSPHVGRKVPTLATAEVTGGRLWLTRVPLGKDGLDAATIYIALAPSDDEERVLVQKVLFGHEAMLFMPDLIAHKAYHQRRQYRQGDIKQRYERAADTLLAQSTALLSHADNPQKEPLQQVSRQCRRFLLVVPELEQLHISLQRQEYNFELWQGRTNGGKIFEFHHSHIKTTLKELSLLIESGQKSLQTTQTTIEIVQTQLNQRREEREQTLQQWLAFSAKVNFGEASCLPPPNSSAKASPPNCSPSSTFQKQAMSMASSSSWGYNLPLGCSSGY